jgi:hypothetical protein
VGTANCTTFGTAGGNVQRKARLRRTSRARQLSIPIPRLTNGWRNERFFYCGVMQRTVAAVNQTSKTATISITTACAASAGACNVAGQYSLDYNFWGSGTACSSVTAGKVVLTFTWTDEAGTVHSAIPAPIIFDQKAAAANVTGTFSFNTSLATEGASGSQIISTNGAAAIQYTATYTACTTGTGTYNLRISTTRLQ